MSPPPVQRLLRGMSHAASRVPAGRLALHIGGGGAGLEPDGRGRVPRVVPGARALVAAEAAGFEPARGFKPSTRLAGGRHRPLGDASSTNEPSGRGAARPKTGGRNRNGAGPAPPPGGRPTTTPAP